MGSRKKERRENGGMMPRAQLDAEAENVGHIKKKKERKGKGPRQTQMRLI